jgi:hypothetical protein
MSLLKLIDNIIKAEMEAFYKIFIIRSKGGRQNYYTCEKDFQKYGTRHFKFENCWAYIKSKEWVESDIYVNDFKSIRKVFLEDMLNGFDSRMEEIINMTDDDDEDLETFIEMRNHFNKLKGDTEKLEYLETMHKNNYYYPNFSHEWLFYQFEDRWLFYQFEDRISDI